jgi:hypothetical protein
MHTSILSTLTISMVNSTVLYDFESSTSGWTGSGTSGGTTISSEWSANGNRSLKANVLLGNSKQFYLKLAQPQNYSGKKILKAYVKGYNFDMTAKLYIKTGSNYTWYDGGANDIPYGKELVLDLTKVSNLNDVKEIGVCFQSSAYAASSTVPIYVDYVRLQTGTEGGTVLWSKEGTALIDNSENVFVFGKNNIAQVNPATGAEIWTNATIPTSSVLFNDNIYISNLDGTKRINKVDGTSVWSNNQQGKLINNSPAGNLLSLVNAGASKKLISIDPNNGSVRWTYNFIADDNSTKVEYATSSVIILSSFVTDMSNYQTTYTISAINTANGSLVWQGPIGNILSIDNNSIYTKSNDAYIMFKYSITDGTKQWEIRDRMVSGLVVDGNYLYTSQLDYNTSQNFIHRINVTTGQTMWSIGASMDYSLIKILSTGALVATRYVVDIGQTSVVLNASNGAQIWSVYPGDIITNGSNVLATQQSGSSNYIQLKDPANGNCYWTFGISTTSYSRTENLYIDNSNAYVYNVAYWGPHGGFPYAGKIYQFNKSTGAVQWISYFAKGYIRETRPTSKYVFIKCETVAYYGEAVERSISCLVK